MLPVVTPAAAAPPYCASSWAVDWYGELYGICWWLAGWNKCSATGWARAVDATGNYNDGVAV